MVLINLLLSSVSPWIRSSAVSSFILLNRWRVEIRHVRRLTLVILTHSASVLMWGRKTWWIAPILGKCRSVKASMQRVLCTPAFYSLIPLHAVGDGGLYLLSGGAERSLIRFGLTVWLVHLLWHNLWLRVVIITLVVTSNDLLYLDLASPTWSRWCAVSTALAHLLQRRIASVKRIRLFFKHLTLRLGREVWIRVRHILLSNHSCPTHAFLSALAWSLLSEFQRCIGGPLTAWCCRQLPSVGWYRVELLLRSVFASCVRTGCIRAQRLVAGDDPLGVACLHISFFLYRRTVTSYY